VIECPSCGMPVKKGATHCSACGEAITSSLTGSLAFEGKRTTSLESPFDAPSVVVEEPALPPTTSLSSASFARSNGEPIAVQTCLRCNSVLNPAAKFCSVCGRATEPTPFERTIDATRSARGRAAAAVKRMIGNVREHPQAKDGLLIASIVCVALAVLCFLYSFFVFPFFVPDKPEMATIAQEIRSLWWLGFGTLLMAVAALLRR